jgi:hypothetical protein
VLRDDDFEVVGAGKSALDCATWSAQHCDTCTLVFRAAHWMVPRYFFGQIRADRFILTRFSELFVRYHSPNRFESFLHGPARAIVTLWWRVQTRLLRRLLRMPQHLVPDRPLPIGFENIGIGAEFYDVLRRGQLVTKRARLLEFAGPTTILLDTGERVEADVVVFATGWRQGIDIDELMRDMRLEPFRARHVFSEYFAPLWPSRYRDVGQERRRARLAASPAN